MRIICYTSQRWFPRVATVYSNYIILFFLVKNKIGIVVVIVIDFIYLCVYIYIYILGDCNQERTSIHLGAMQLLSSIYV